MFTFHKPKIYRSISGCCICKAKSSSSRFTDSKKYESEFEKCFRISEKRSGEICNACVLLVKRWKKLPPGTLRHWRHVVDARAGPGTKSINHKKHKPKKLRSPIIDYTNECQGEDVTDENTARNVPSPIGSDSSDLDDDDEAELEDEDYLSDYDEQKRVESGLRRLNRRFDSRAIKKDSTGAIISQASDDRNKSTNHRHPKKSQPTTTTSKISSFLDMSFWRKEKICCGIIFKGPNNEVLIYPKLLKACSCRRKMYDSKSSASEAGASSDTASITSVSQIDDDQNSNGSTGNVLF